jgi:Neuraminidase (sialidase)
MCCREFAGFPIFCVLLVAQAAVVVGDEWKPHAVRQRNGSSAETSIPAKLQIVSEQQWNRAATVPYLVYMEEPKRLMLLINCDSAMLATSDDQGTTWSKPRYLHLDGQGKPDVGMATGLTYLGGGKLLTSDGAKHWFSKDYGETWTSAANPPASNGKTWYEWDPLLVDKDTRTGKIVRLMSYCSDNLQPDGHFQGYIRFSADEGATWTGEIKVPEMYAVNETAFLRARSGDIVAACRTDSPERFKNEIDHYNGLGISISKDNGRTWSKPNMLYELGRHHPSMVLMPNGDIVMSYVVRKGYIDTPDGFPQFGIEAVVSHDDGHNWDLDHRYILHTWAGNRKKSPNESQPGPQAWWASCQCTSTVRLPDGSLLTTFSTGYRIPPGPNAQPTPRDVGLVLWRLGD